MKKVTVIIMLLATVVASAKGDAALDALMERLSPGLSRHISIELTAHGPDTADFYSVAPGDDGLRIRANNRVSAAVGLNRYLRDVAGVQPSWDCMKVDLPDPLPRPEAELKGHTRQRLRYYLNYCTHSYSMPFWDETRWQQEIDWMALHGINAPLAATGSEAVWHASLSRLGYPEELIDSFIAAPAYQAWWLMNNLEGEGRGKGPRQTIRQAELQRSIIAGMRALDIEPVLPGYSGMLPHDAAAIIGMDVADPGFWCGYPRPAFLLPTDKDFARVASIYYEEQARLFGPARYYSMDPFHEGGRSGDVDLGEAARAIERAMLEASPEAVWLIQGWQENPRPEMLDALTPGRLAILDLHAETCPQWSARGHRGHPWIWCMLLNFGGNEGLHGKLDHIARAYGHALHSDNPPCGVGLTMEGIENNPVMYELACDLPWMADTIDTRRWLRRYVAARYGSASQAADSAWTILANSIYGAGESNRQQGTTESPFCIRPSRNPVNASTWANAEPYYNGTDVIRAATILSQCADSLGNNRHYLHDLVDVTRQAVAEAGRIEISRLRAARQCRDKAAYVAASRRFMNLIMLQDSLLSTLPEFTVNRWIGMARNAAADPGLADAMESDARRLITVWGSRNASEKGQLHDYAHREWAGLLRDFYAPRWQAWFDASLSLWESDADPDIDFYSMESQWADSLGGYPPSGDGKVLEVALLVIGQLATYLSL